jgi:hypothetical protein
MRPLVAVLISLLISSSRLTAAGPLIIHEWGTFTSLQNEKGEAIGGINVDTELLPAFVHNFAPGILPNAPAGDAKGLLSARPRLDVTMRLETPVVYFHLPADAGRPLTLDLTVRFAGCWLTQFYPDAAADIDGRPVKDQPLGPIAPTTSTSVRSGGLAWRGLEIGTQNAGPATTSRVWLAPRDVKSDRVTTARGESEQYLFYRGVGHIDAPLRVVRITDDLLHIETREGF